MATFIMLGILALLSKSLLVYGADICKRKPRLFLKGNCEETFKPFCCMHVDETGITTRNASNPKECTLPFQTLACLAGFYKSKNDSVSPCPDGYFCPEYLTCVIPCPNGSFCKSSMSEAHSNGSLYQGRSGSVQPILIGKQWIYPGNKIPDICEKGYFCASSKSKIQCPEGSYCRRGMMQPEKCIFEMLCKQGGHAHSGVVPSAFVGAFIAASLAVIFLACKYKARIQRCIANTRRRFQPSNKCKIANIRQTFEAINLVIMMNSPTVLNHKHQAQKVDIIFQNLRLRKHDKQILSGVDGELRAGTLTAIMGPSGGGKTILLKALSGRISRSNLTGSIYLNGVRVKNVSEIKRVTGFVPQEDVMHGNLTVREILTYQALLRLGKSASKQTIKDKVDNILEMLDIKLVQDSLIFNGDESKLSGGQRKRVNVGMELVTDPAVLFLDEPTSGLDSSTTLSIMKALKALADRGLTVVSVIHQPRYEVFSMLQSILLMSNDGKTVVQGTPTKVTEYFKALGVVASDKVNPADCFMDAITGISWNKGTRDDTRKCRIMPWKIEISNESISKSIETSNNNVIKGEKRPGFLSQFCILIRREFLLQQRTVYILILDYLLTMVAGLLHGLMYEEVDLLNIGPMATMGTLMMGVTSMLVSFRLFTNHRAEFLREADSGVHVTSYYFAMEASHLLHIVFLPLAYLSLNYTIIWPQTPFLFLYSASLLVYFSTSGFAYLVSIVMNPKNAQMTAVVYALVSSLLSGTAKSLCELNALSFVGPMLYNLSYSKWFAELIFVKEQELVSPAFRPIVDIYQIRNNYSLDNPSVCVAVLLAMGLSYRCLAYFAIIVLAKRK